jgi:hypothetical protein
MRMRPGGCQWVTSEPNRLRGGLAGEVAVVVIR